LPVRDRERSARLLPERRLGSGAFGWVLRGDGAAVRQCVLVFSPRSLSRGTPMADLIPTTVVGSYPQPDWLVDRDQLGSRVPPGARAREIWRVAEPFLEQAQDDATLLSIRDMERAGVDIISDGEIRRESYSNRFATALDGFDLDHPGTAIDRTGHPNP